MPEGRLQRQLSARDAVVVGAGSMVGAGVFTAWSPAVAVAGHAALAGLAIAGVIAMCNAMSSAQLAARHPESGGTYVYGRARLSPLWGFAAGWGFVIGKLASSAAVALTIGTYLAPGNVQMVAIASVLIVTAVNIGGLSRTAHVTRWLLGLALTTLAMALVSGWWSIGEATPVPTDGISDGIMGASAGPLAIAQSAGFLFFAFAGYARIATLGEEVVDPARTIPYAVPRALAAVLGLYVVVGVSLILVLGPEQVAATNAPVRALLERGPGAVLTPVLQVGVALAAAGVLLNLIPGISRTMLAMARHHDLPRVLAHIHPGRNLPLRAELTVAALVIGIVAITDLRGAIGFSGVAILTYYAITNASALKLAASERRWPRAVAWLGLVGCAALAVTLPVMNVLVALGVFAIGISLRSILRGVRGTRIA